MSKQKFKLNHSILVISIIFMIWSAIFIYEVSFIAINGRRYVTLFDDAMISMRYAWNFAHGMGLVWNPGEYVEGYTNLLMTLFMSFVILIVDECADARVELAYCHGLVSFLASRRYQRVPMAQRPKTGLVDLGPRMNRPEADPLV